MRTQDAGRLVRREDEGGGAHAGGGGERDLDAVVELDLVGAGLGFLVGVGEVRGVVVAEVVDGER